MKKYLILTTICFLFTNLVESQTVPTQYGPIIGHMNGSVYEFLGIPYAAPPVDTLRWKPSMAHENWLTPIIADSFPPVCPQKRFEQGQPDSVFTLEGDEDCLYLNVWSPDISSSLPVMVFIHGGGNQQGSTSQLTGGTEIYHGKNLAQRGNVVVVTIEYRLGVLGYLVHPGLEIENPNGISGNYGVMDQIFALQWVQNNISNFGGNPNNVTIFGESAGGVNVGNLLTTPLADGLFHKAIIESAVPMINDYNDSKTKGIDFVDDFISTGTDAEKIAFMRDSVIPDSITINMKNPLSGGIAQMNWQPVIDNYVFDDYPEIVFQSGNFNKVPLIIGSNSEEMAFGTIGYPNALCALMVDSIINYSVPINLQPTAYLYYPITPLSVAKNSLIGILTDPQFTATTRRTAQCVSLNQTEPVWRYFFTHKHTFPGGADMGSYHGMELFYVFNTWENATLGTGFLFKPADDSVQQVMLNYWVNFAYTGDPNVSGLPVWPQYQSATDCYMEIKATPDGSQCGIRTAQSDFWDDVVEFTGCTTSVGVENAINNKPFICYPNPTNGIIKIDLPENVVDFELSVYNSFGQKVHFSKNAIQYDLTKQCNGLYFIEVRTKGEIFKGKIIKTE